MTFLIPTTLRPYTEGVIQGVNLTAIPSSSLYGLELIRTPAFVSISVSQSLSGDLTGSMTGTFTGNLNGSTQTAFSTSSLGNFTGQFVGCFTGSGNAAEISGTVVRQVPKTSISPNGVNLFDAQPMDGVTRYYQVRHIDDYGHGSAYTDPVAAVPQMYSSLDNNDSLAPRKIDEPIVTPGTFVFNVKFLYQNMPGGKYFKVFWRQTAGTTSPPAWNQTALPIYTSNVNIVIPGYLPDAFGSNTGKLDLYVEAWIDNTFLARSLVCYGRSFTY